MLNANEILPTAAPDQEDPISSATMTVVAQPLGTQSVGSLEVAIQLLF